MALPDVTQSLQLLPAKVRTAIYVGYGVLVTLLGAAQVGFAAVPDLETPVWLTVTLAVTTFVGVYVSALAAVNVKSPEAERQPEIPGL